MRFPSTYIFIIFNTVLLLLVESCVQLLEHTEYSEKACIQSYFLKAVSIIYTLLLTTKTFSILAIP